MNHKEKTKLARKLRKCDERKAKTRIPIFETDAWEVRKRRIARRVAKIQSKK